MTNKLKLICSIPALSLVLSTGIIATSCNSNRVEDIYKTEITEDYDDPSITPIVDEEKLYNQDDITNLYINWVNSDPMLFVKDMTWAAAQKYNEFAEIYFLSEHPGHDHAKLDKCEFGYSKPTFGTTTVWETGFDDKTYNTISFHQTVYLEYSIKTGYFKIVKKVNVDITYSNVIFMISESNEMGDASKTPNWNIGILDPWFKDESFWIYQYNTMPWSIDYGASFETTKTIYGHGTPDVNIHKCSYLSGNVNSAIKFYNLWNFWRKIESPTEYVPPEEITCDELLEARIIKCIMSFEYGSKRLSNLINKPEVCVIDQLNGEYFDNPTDENPICLHKIDLIYPKIPSFDRNSVTVQLDFTPEEVPGYIICNGISDPEKKLKIVRDQTLVPDESEAHNDEEPSKAYKLPIYDTTGHWGRPDSESFNVPFRSLKVKIGYNDTKHADTQYVDTDLYLHYNTFILYRL